MNDLAMYELGAGLPKCAVCKKPVDKVTSSYHPNFDGKLFRVYCHGQVEEGLLSAFTLINSTEIIFSTAFEAKL